MCVRHEQSMCRCNVASKMFSTPVCNDQKKGALHVDVHLDVVMFTCVVRRLLLCFHVLSILIYTMLLPNIYVVQFICVTGGRAEVPLLIFGWQGCVPHPLCI